MRRHRGFTLIELLVAISILAVMAVLSWRGLEGMTRAVAQTRERSDQLLTLQAGLDQWTDDLDALMQQPQMTTLDWNGNVLRMTRLAPNPSDGMLVVAWARRDVDGTGQWLRWQSAPLLTRGDLDNAWSEAALWALRAAREAQSDTAHMMHLIVEGEWFEPLEDEDPDGPPPSFVTTYDVVADDEAEARRLIAECEPPQVRESLRVVETHPIEHDPEAPTPYKGVYATGDYHMYQPGDDID